MKVLHPLEIATAFISGEYKCSFSSVFPVIHGLVNQLSPAEDDSSVISEFKCTVISALKRRWSLEQINVQQLSILSTALDPRFKNMKFLDVKQRADVEDRVISMATTVRSGVVSSPPSPKRTKSALDQLLGDADDDETVEESGIEDECKRYFSERLLPRNSDPIEWWKVNKFKFPHVAAVAKSVLAVPATSTSSERLFSTAGLTVTKLRNCLKPDNVNALVFLNKNFNFLEVSKIQV